VKFRIAIWAGVGAVVVVLWTLYISATSPTPPGAVWTFPLKAYLPLFASLRALAYLTCPIALVHHYALSFYFVLFVNAATYALVGMVVETMRRHHKQT
jgi:hypothetical protein